MNLKKTIAFLVMGMVLVTAVITVARPAAAQSSPNLLVNPGFEEGHHHQDGIAEITVPDGYRMHWVDGVAFFDSYNGLPALRPETVVWDAAGGIPVGEEVLWRDGQFTLKIFKSWAPLYAGLSQDVSGLEVGRRYQLVAPVYTDIYDWEGQKVYPADATHGQVRLGASPVGAAWRDEAAIAYSGWFASTYGDYGIFAYEFTATQSDMTVWIDVKGNYPHSNNGFFMDTLGLYALDATAPVSSGGGSAAPVVPAGPTSTPLPPPTPRADGSVVHVVQSGDTMWTIANQYAAAMGMTPEEALPAIQELNNNPAFLSVGQELVIVPANLAAEPAPVVEETPVVEEAPAEEVTPEAETTEETGAGPDTAVAGGSADLPEPEPIAAAEPAKATICVSVFSDDNGDGVLNQGTEGLLADAAITVSRSGETVVTYVTDGLHDEQCFEDLESDTYQVQFFPPADYMATTDDSWAVAVSGGVQMPVSFGAQFSPAAEAVVADAGATDTTGGEETAVTAETPAEDATVEPADTGSNIGMIIIGVAVFLVVLAAIGIALLRRA
ncbi:MAG: LysM peptidoglycan-binding domain-containing protein [Ardenticatenaceae bacterium]|nr:LysM peptidoglycan-binding domain-containing protein [Anaerolineales bacterium]MCB8922328.1 LysM peptidoglycan-binding domain-containing protein [Ardenticatenaceae bacterium]